MAMPDQASNTSENAQLNIEFSQAGIPPFPSHAAFVTVFLKPENRNCFDEWLKLAQMLEEVCNQVGQGLVCVRGVDFELWSSWCKEREMPLPKGMTDHEKLKQKPFAYSGGDLWFHIKGETEQACSAVLQTIVSFMKPMMDHYIHTDASKRHDGKVFGGRFRDAMINPVDPVNLSERAIVGGEDAFYRGAAYVLQQKFKHNWDRLDDMTAIEKENMIGRNHQNAIVPMPDDRSHIKCVRQLNGQRVTQRILRQAIPFGKSPTGGGREEGVYFVAYANEGEVYHQLMENIIGTDTGFVKDKMLNNSHAESGNLWFVPPANILNVEGVQRPDVPLNEYYNVRSDNGLMFYNNRDFLHSAQKVNGEGIDAISDRIMILASQNFSRWNDTWEKTFTMPALGHLKDYLKEPTWQQFKDVGESGAVVLRKGLAIKISLSDVLLRDEFRESANLFTITENEIIVGNMPPLTLGTGTQVMEYLFEDEKIEGFFGNLNEYSATGHNIPHYQKVLRLGMGGLLDEAKHYHDKASDDKKAFYQSVIWALEGMQAFIQAYAEQAKYMAEEGERSEFARENLTAIANRMQRLSIEPPKSMLDCLQLIFIVNCALHQTGEPMSIGRLDQYLIDYYEKEVNAGTLDEKSAQELIDAFWLKMDETVLYNRQHMQDYLTYGTGAVFYSGGNFPQGSALNQWVQQVTVGGYLPTEDPEPQDGCNHITLMCLRASRRLPLNAPCLSLRVHKKMNSALHQEIIAEAAKTVLSGGGHPVMLNDDKLCNALKQCGPLTLADSRDYVCDGCYEPIIQGKTEWAFSYVPVLPVVGMAMNQGATIEGAGWIHLRGLKTGWNSPPAENIASFEQFMDIFYTQYKWLIAQFFNTLMNGYGSLWNYCPSPLFSSMTEGCMESGKDMSDGGATYHIVAPMMCGITDAINSLYTIKKLVFEEDTALTTLPELLQALYNNWGQNMQEPFQNEFAGQARADDRSARYKQLREAALDLPKFGEGTCQELKDFADSVVGRLVEIIHQGIQNPVPSVKQSYDALKEKYRLDGREFAFTVTPGVGTFEDNIGLGVTMGASADGRLSGDPVADDFCAAPSPSDQPPQTEPFDVFTSLKDWNVESINTGLANAAPIDLNIQEDFCLADMEEVIRQFANSDIGSNLITVTTANPETYQQSQTFPEKYDLVRVRQGGWSEFYIAMFPEHQKYIARRPYYAVKK